MRRFSLRWLVLGTVLGAIMVAFTGFALYLDQVEQGNRLADIDAELVRAARARTPAPQTGRRPAPSNEEASPQQVALPEAQTTEETPIDTAGVVELTLDSEGMLITEFSSANPFDAATTRTFVEGDGNLTIADPRYRIMRSTDRNGLVMVTGLSLDDFDSAVRRFRAALLGGGAVLLSLVGVVLWGLTGLLLRP